MTLWWHLEHTLNTPWTHSEHTLNTLWTHFEQYPQHTLKMSPRFDKISKNINDSVTDSPTWIQEMLAHLKSLKNIFYSLRAERMDSWVQGLRKVNWITYMWSKNKWYGMNYESLFDIRCLPFLNDLRTASSWYFCHKVIHFGPIGAQASDSKSAVSTNGKAGNWLRPLPPSSSAPLPGRSLSVAWVVMNWETMQTF